MQIKKLITLSLFFFSQAVMTIAQNPSFISLKNSYGINEKVTFVNTTFPTKGDSIFIWNFGDECRSGPIYLRSGCNKVVKGYAGQTHHYLRPGKYTVSLAALGNGNKIFSKQITIAAPGSPVVSTYKNSGTETVANGGFETCSQVPVDLGELSLSEHWYSATEATPDLFHKDFDTTIIYDFSVKIPRNFAGTSYPADAGNVYAGLIALSSLDSTTLNIPDTSSPVYNYREYIQQKLPSPLVKGKKYLVKVYSKLSSKSRMSAKIGLCITGDVLTTDTTGVIYRDSSMTIPDRPDTVHWFCDSLIFRASGGEQYITIGNFTGDESRLFTDRYPSNRIRSVYGAFSASFAYYYIDKVSLKLLTLADQERFTILSTGVTSRDTIIVRDTINPSDSIRFIDYSVGQRVIKTFLTIDSAHYLTQGFLQPLMSIGKSLINKPESSDRILDVYFYPNPTERYLNIKITNPLKGKIMIKAFSSLGFQAYSLSRETAENLPILIRLDLYNLQSGTYLFRVMGSGCHSSYFKIVKL